MCHSILVLKCYQKMNYLVLVKHQQMDIDFFSNIYFLITYCIIPSSVMFFFDCLTIKNVDLSKRQIVPTNTTILLSLHRKNRQFICMVIIQVVSFILLRLPVGIRKLYALFTGSSIKSQLTLAMDDFAHKFLRLESIVYYSFNFFLVQDGK